MKTYELMSIYGKNKKGYYGKAVVIEDENGNLFLQSYSTIVCAIAVSGKVVKFWDGYSTTTMQHINDFLLQNGFSAISKKEWENIPVESCPIHPINSSYKVTYY